MEPLPANPSFPTPPGATAGDLAADAERELEGLGLEELRTELLLQADQLSLQETRELLGPVRERYPGLGQMPLAELRTLVARLAIYLRSRTPSCIIQRYRSGRFLALPPLSAEVWNLLPHAGRLRLLEQDNRALDVAQAARHLAKLYLSPDYFALGDAAALRLLVASPQYPAIIQRLLGLPSPQAVPGVLALHRRVTQMALGMEESPREARGAQHLAIRRTIGEALGIPAADQA